MSAFLTSGRGGGGFVVKWTTSQTRIESKSRHQDCQFPFYTKTQHKLNRGGAREIEKVTRLGNLHRVYSITPRSVTVANERRDKRARRRRRRKGRSSEAKVSSILASPLPSFFRPVPPLSPSRALSLCSVQTLRQGRLGRTKSGLRDLSSQSVAQTGGAH